MKMRRLFSLLALLSFTVLAACAHQAPDAVAPGAPGFWAGLWHGFIFPIAWFFSLFSSDVAVYAVPNNGGWYDFGYFLGICVFGVGANGGRKIVYRQRIIYRDRPARRGVVIENE